MWSAAAPQPGSAGSTRYVSGAAATGFGSGVDAAPGAAALAGAVAGSTAGSRARRRSRPGGRLRAQHFVGGPGADDRDQRQRDRPPGPRRPRVLRHRQLADRRCGRMQRRGVEPGVVAAARQRGEHGVGVELEQAGVVAHEPPDEGASRQLREVAVLHRPHLARMRASTAARRRRARGRPPRGRRAAGCQRGRACPGGRRRRIASVHSLVGLRSAVPIVMPRVGRPRSTGGRPCGLSLRAPAHSQPPVLIALVSAESG